VLSPGATVNAAGLSMHLPGGWRQSQVLQQAFGTVVPVATFDGPSGATLAVATLRTPIAGDMQAIVDRIDTMTGEQSLTGRSMRDVTLPVGHVLEMQIDVDGHAGTVVLIPHNDGELYELELHSAGSVKASVDFQRMLQGLSLQR
jgi:hypothetical protein